MDRIGGRISSRMVRRWVLPGLFLPAALVFWVAFLGQAEESPFGRVPLLDEIYYLDQAAAWAQGPFPPADPYFVSPLYPLVLALAGGGGGVPESRVFAAEQLRGVRVFQISCWLGVVLLLRLIAGQVLRPRLNPGWGRDLAVWLPAVLFALYRPAAVYAVSILLEMPLVFLMTLAVHLMIRLAERSGKGGATGLLLGLGAVIGLAGLLRGTALLLLIPGLALAAGQGIGAGRRALRVLLVLGAVAVTLAPAVIHNSRIAGWPTGPTLNGGVNLFIGNGPEANGFYVAVVAGDWRRDPAGRASLGEMLGTPAPTLAEADRIWSRLALSAVADNPARAAGLWMKKVWLHLQGWEIDQLTPLDRWRRYAPALNLLPVPFALLTALGLGGLVGLWRDIRVRWLAVVLGILVAGQSVFFVVSRYRLALVPVLCLLAVVGGLEILRGNRKAIIAGLLAALVTIPWGLEDTRMMWRAQASANEALRWAEIGQADDSPEALRTAETMFREAVAGRAAGPAPWLGLAALLAERGERAEAARILEEGAAVTARNLDINKTLLALWLEDARREPALELTARILQDHPRDADTLHNRTVLLAESGRTEEAMILATELITVHPGEARGYIDLGVILARAGRRDEAREVFSNGLRVVPGDPHLQQNLDLLNR